MAIPSNLALSAARCFRVFTDWARTSVLVAAACRLFAVPMAVGLDGSGRRDRTYFDLGATRSQAEQTLKIRIYELDAPLEQD